MHSFCGGCLSVWKEQSSKCPTVSDVIVVTYYLIQVIVKYVTLFFLAGHHVRHMYWLCQSSRVSVGHVAYVVTALVMQTPVTRVFH